MLRSWGRCPSLIELCCLIACTGPHQFAPNVGNSNLDMVRWSACNMSIADGASSIGHMDSLQGTGAR